MMTRHLPCRILPALVTLVALTVAGAVVPVMPLAQDFARTNLDANWPVYDEPPYQFTGSRGVIVSFATDPQVVRTLVPQPMTPDSGGQISLVVVRHHVTAPLEARYNEAFLSIPVSIGGVSGDFLPVLYLDQAGPITCGREIWGFRKVDARIDIEEADGVYRAVVYRDGAAIIRLEATLVTQLQQIPVSPSRPILNLKLIPSCEVGTAPQVKQLTAVTLADRTTHELHMAQAELSFASTPLDPLADIPIQRVGGAWFFVNDFVQGHGEVVYDYLAADE